MSQQAPSFSFFFLRPEEVVEEPFFPRRSHEDYRDALERLDIADSEMGTRWITAAERVTAEAVAVTPPVEEIVFFDPRDPGAVGYRFPVTRGRRIEISISAGHDRYFADVFRLEEVEEGVANVPGAAHGEETSDGAGASRTEDGGLVAWRPDELVASRPEGDDRVVFESRANNFYLLRIQPELLRGGRFEVSIRESAPLAFPVEDTGPGDVWSFFGDPRDGGARIHHGIDIFAPRGTPVLAVSDGEIVRVGRRDRGGNVVVLRDTIRGLQVYYAHLESHLVENGVSVRAGDVLGTVGNTGNAVTTPPHLHIGIYQGGWRRPVDPWPYMVGPPEVDGNEGMDAETLLAAAGTSSGAPVQGMGPWTAPDGAVTITDTYPGVAPSRDELPRARRNRNPFLRGAGDTFVGAEAEADPDITPRRPLEDELAGGTPLRILGVTSTGVRVRTVAGRVGIVPSSVIDESDGTIRLTGDRVVRDVLSGDEITPFVEGISASHIADVSGRALVVLPSGDLAVLGEEL